MKQVGRYRILPFLKEQGTGILDYVLVTHTDGDHISGIEELIIQAAKPGGIRIGTLLLSGQSMEEEPGLRLKELAEKVGISVKEFWRIKVQDLPVFILQKEMFIRIKMQAPLYCG